MKNKPDEQLNWREEFDNEFVSGAREDDWCRPMGKIVVKPSQVKVFISKVEKSAILNERKRIKKNLENLVPVQDNDKHNKSLLQLLNG